VPPRLHCRQATESDPVPEDHPSASWSYCAVGSISSIQGPSAEPTGHSRHRRTAAGMANPSGHDQGNEPAVEPADESAETASVPDGGTERQPEAAYDAPTAAAPVVEDHPTEI